MKNKRQLIFIHGGMTFKNRQDYLNYLKNRPVSFDAYESWSGKYLDKNLSAYLDIHRLKMPLKENSNYEDWKIYFERHIPLMKSGLVLMGNSLGGIFLAKYLSENKFPKNIKALYLVAPPFDNSLPDEDLVGGFKLKNDLGLILKNCSKTRLFFSEDDSTVPLSQAGKYLKKIPKAEIFVLKNKNGHFRVEKFPEIIKMIKSDLDILS